jgi:hypothetical protein
MRLEEDAVRRKVVIRRQEMQIEESRVFGGAEDIVEKRK